MFKLPDTKRVCREDIKTTPSSCSPSPGSTPSDSYTADALQHIYSSLETFTAHNDTSDARPDSNPTPITDEDAEKEFEFRLFHAPTQQAASGSQGNVAATTNPSRQEGEGNILDNHGVQKLKIRLRSPSPSAGEGGFVVPFRGWGYYLSDPEKVLQMLNNDRTGETHGPWELGQKGSYHDVAMTGEEVMALAKSSKWPGCHLPWRIIHLQTTAANKSSPKNPKLSHFSPTPAITSHQKEKKKTKPGKKRRIVLRQRLASKKAEEEADRDKRTRRNREKKVKRRQKEREKKAAMRNAAGDADTGKGKGEEESCQESS